MEFSSSWVREAIIVTLASIVCNKIQELEESLKYEDVWAYYGVFFCWILVCLFFYLF